MSLLALFTAVGSASAQTTPRNSERDHDEPRRAGRAFVYSFGDDRDRPRLGISLGSSGRRDTLGVLVDAVTPESPAAKAGLEEGDRIQAINGVNLRVAAADVDDEELAGIGARRLTRELSKHKAGDEVELRVWREGNVRTMKVKTVAAKELAESAMSLFNDSKRNWEDRATLGISLGTSGSKRDTLGILISSLSDDGPAAKAGIEEGDRIAAINGVDVRVAREDAGDWESSSSRVRRLEREVGKLKAGDEVELRLYRGGQTRTVKFKTVRAKDLSDRDGGMFFFNGSRDGDRGDLGMWDRALAPLPPTPPMPPMPSSPAIAPTPPLPPLPPERLRLHRLDMEDLNPSVIRMRVSPEVMDRARSAMERALQNSARVRPHMRIDINALPRTYNTMPRLTRARLEALARGARRGNLGYTKYYSRRI